jgi:hypothetical protein
MNENQARITDLLMQVTHRVKDPDTYVNKQAGGSCGTHEEVIYNLEKAPGSEGSLGGVMFHGKMGSRANHRPYMPVFTDENIGLHSGRRANPRSYMPTFTYEQGQHEQVEDYVEQLARSTKEYYNLDMRVQRQMSLDQYCQLRFRNQPRMNHRGSFEFERRVGKIEIPYFYGTTKMIAQAWVKKLGTYLQLNPMREMEAIKFATMYLDGKAHIGGTMGSPHSTTTRLYPIQNSLRGSLIDLIKEILSYIFGSSPKSRKQVRLKHTLMNSKGL